MANKPTPAAEIIDIPMNMEVLDQERRDLNSLALITAQQDSAVRAVAHQMGYQLPADCTDPDLIQRDISANMRRSVEACLEVGKGLRVLKEACGHGNFMARIDVLGIEYTVATRFMHSAAKFSKVATSQTLKAIGNQSKLFEMLLLDDAQIEELELTGQTGELALDDVATMSLKELRTKLRQERLVANRMKMVNDELNTELALNKNLKIAATDWPERFKGLMDQAQFASKNIKLNIGSLDAIREAALKDDPADAQEQAGLLRAREVLATEMLDIYRKCADYLDGLGMVFDKTLGCFAPEAR
jgi:hypothetical protein